MNGARPRALSISRTPPHSPSRHLQHRRPGRRVKAPLPLSQRVSHPSLRGVCVILIGFPASDPASAGRRCHRYAVREISRPGRTYSHSSMQSYGQSTQFCAAHRAIERDRVPVAKRRRVVLAEVQHMEAAQARFAQKARPNQTIKRPAPNKKAPPGSGRASYPNMYIVL